MSQIERLSQKYEELQEPYKLLSQKIAELRKAYVIETDSSIKFKLENQLDQLESEWNQLGEQLDDLERRISHDALYQALTMEEIEQLGLNIETITDEMMQLDYESLEGLTEEHEGNKQLLIDRWRKNPECGKIIIYDKVHPVGYWTFLPLFEEIFNKFKAGKGFEGELTPQAIRSIGYPGIYHLYFIGINRQKGHHNITMKKLLIFSFLETLEDLAKEGIFFEDICANAFTEEGVAMCKDFEMEKIADHFDKGEIYYRHLYPFPDSKILNRTKNLVRLYTLKFKNIKGK